MLSWMMREIDDLMKQTLVDSLACFIHCFNEGVKIMSNVLGGEM
jgi:hypothetical protein